MRAKSSEANVSKTLTERVARLRSAIRSESASAAGIHVVRSKKNEPGFQKFHNSTPPFDNKPDYPTWDKRGR